MTDRAASVRSGAGAGPWRVAAAALAATAAVVVLNPTQRHIPLCPIKAATGLDCPLCGGLRAVWSLAHGRVGDAADHNVLVVAAIPLLVMGWLWWMVSERSNRAVPRLPRWLLVPLIAVALAFAVARNLTPFAWLASDIA